MPEGCNVTHKLGLDLTGETGVSIAADLLAARPAKSAASAMINRVASLVSSPSRTPSSHGILHPRGLRNFAPPCGGSQASRCQTAISPHTIIHYSCFGPLSV